MTAPLHIVSISGGADSLATALLAIERANKRAMNLRFMNADLGANESQITHDYIGYLQSKLGITIERVRANFEAEFAARRETIQSNWSVEKRRKEHTKACKSRREIMRPVDWRKSCDCPVRVSPPVPQEDIDRAKALLIPTGEPFLDLCMLKGRFPSRQAQFCTERLKLEPMNAVTHPILESGGHIVSWIGEMAEESPKRAAKPQMQRIRWPDGGGSLVLYRPIQKWTKADNFALAKRHGVLPNKLYQMGMGRVGCFCVNQSKNEIAQWDQRFPEVIDRIAEWEKLVAAVSRSRSATFFHGSNGKIGGGVKALSAEEIGKRANIRRVAEWARTSRGGKQFDLLQRLNRDRADEEGAMCESAYGLCE